MKDRKLPNDPRELIRSVDDKGVVIEVNFNRDSTENLDFVYAPPAPIEEMTPDQLRKYLSVLHDQLDEMDAVEPDDEDSEDYEDWAEEHEYLEDLLDDVMDRIDELSEQ